MITSPSSRTLLGTVFPLLLILVIITLHVTSATADENIAVRVGAEKHRNPNMDGVLSLVTQDLNTSITPNDLANILVGDGITVTNVFYLGADSAAGVFSGGTNIIGFDKGIILSSGDMNDVVGPNLFDSTTTTQNTPGDLDLTILSGFPTFDASILEFDFVSDNSQVFFQFIFASEEYNEFVGQTFNDVFGFFINGQNCALVENDPISINTIHNGVANQGPGSHPELYRNNDRDDGGPTIETEADGLTIVLTCSASVIANSTNHVKLAIADATDRNWDSWVFLKAGSLTTKISITLGPNPGEACLSIPHTLVATIADFPQENVPVSFEVISGPNSGYLGSSLTNVDGQATLTYLSSVIGIDVVRASFIGSDSQLKTSKLVNTSWSFCSDPTATPLPTPLPTATPTPIPVPSCELYPIAIHADSLSGISVGDVIEDIDNGSRRGNFGWLTWTGNVDVGALTVSLSPPGNSYSYVNPYDSNDHLVTVGDWVEGRPGLVNSSQIRQSLDNLITYAINIPVWDVSQGDGNNVLYRVADFVQVRITEYHLPGQNRISAVFQGYASCNSSHINKLEIKRIK